MKADPTLQVPPGSLTAVRLVLAASCLAMLAVGANSTAIMAALPTARRDLGLDAGEVEWAINAYLVASAACIIPGGKAADRHGAGPVAVVGVLLFAAASVVIALAATSASLLGGRALQGIGAALAVPGTLAAIGATATAERRGAAIGAWAGCLMAGFSIGPLFGGAATHALGWRAVFWINAAAMAASAAALAMAPRESPAARQGQRAGFDWLGAALLATFMVALVFALHALPEARRAPMAVLVPLALALAALMLLIRTERRVRQPLLDLGVVAKPAFLRAAAIGAIAMFCILALLLYFNLDAQSPEGFGLSPVGAGLALLPLCASLLAVAIAAPRLVTRFGARHALAAAMAATVAAAAAVGASASERSMALLAVSLLVLGAGLALPYATAPKLALATLPTDQAGQGSGVINACTFLGGSLGVSFGAVAYASGGLGLVMGLVAGAALLGVALASTLPRETRG